MTLWTGQSSAAGFLPAMAFARSASHFRSASCERKPGRTLDVPAPSVPGSVPSCSARRINRSCLSTIPGSFQVIPSKYHQLQPRFFSATRRAPSGSVISVPSSGRASNRPIRKPEISGLNTHRGYFRHCTPTSCNDENRTAVRFSFSVPVRTQKGTKRNEKGRGV